MSTVDVERLTIEQFEQWKESRSTAIAAWLDDWRSRGLLGMGCGSAEFEGLDWRAQAIARLWGRMYFRHEVERRHGALGENGGGDHGK